MKINPEFFKRHLFAFVLVFGLGCWFGYDGFVKYPSMTPNELYRACHSGNEPASAAEAEKFSANAIPRQKQFMAICLVFSALIGAHLASVARFKFEFDNNGFTYRGKRYAFGDIRSVDRSNWAKKSIVTVKVDDGDIRLDAWHHLGVKEFYALLPAEVNAAS